MKLLLIYGGNSNEHDISIKSAETILKNYPCDSIYISKENIWYHNDKKIINIIKFLKKYDIILPMIHGQDGEDGNLQGFLNLFKIPYIGTKLESFICMDKYLTKQLLAQNNINQVPYQLSNEPLKIKYPIIIKPANGGSSIGINKANNDIEYEMYLKEALKYDDKVIIEKFIKARELECAVIKNKTYIMNIGEIIPNQDFYNYDSKYNNPSKTIVNPTLPKHLEKEIYETSKKIFEILNLKDFARIDYFYDGKKLYLNEINTIPGFTEISMFPKLIMDKGYSYEQLIKLLIKKSS